ncbi:hypothetical protein G4B88_012021 [Cannabis sativa]|uniref:microtubule-severing ATPase n=1 Tax=Cannabis sativa TaxID=3483 RepID=A0A7J6HCG8_CANSA|nr:hypothetical protein G4B88_012021 [Cannabis sativa]
MAGSGGTSITKSGLVPAQKTTVASKHLLVPLQQRSGEESNKNSANTKPAQESGGNYEAKLVEMINTSIVDTSPSVKWEDVAGLEKAKQALMEMVIYQLREETCSPAFEGQLKNVRHPNISYHGKTDGFSLIGLLLFGPPGNGKTMLAKAVASESEATFFNVSASSLTSKWVRFCWMWLSFILIDSIMSTRLANENDASRRLKSEFLIQFDGVTSNNNDLVIVIGATNKPQELDDAVLRRLVKRIYVPLPDDAIRRLLLRHKLKGQAFSLPSGDLERLAKETEGYSGSDLQALCEEAALMPIRELGENILTVKANQVRPLRFDDFRKAMSVIRPSLNKNKWEELEKWNLEFGSN